MLYHYGITQTGGYHLANGTVCQDAHDYRKLGDRLAIAAVADGVGSEEHSDIASKTAVQTAITHCAERISTDTPENEILGVLEESFEKALAAVNETAKRNGHSEDQYDTTLVLAVYREGRVWFGVSGDSGIIVQKSDGSYEALAEMRRDEDGCVFPLAFGKDMWEFGCCEDVSSVLLATDGVYETFFPFLLRDCEEPKYLALLHFMMCNGLLRFEESGEEAVRQKMDTFLDSIPDYQVYDDKTVVVMLDTEVPFNEKPYPYYEEPDFAALRKKREEKYLREAYPSLYDIPPEDSSQDEKSNGQAG